MTTVTENIIDVEVTEATVEVVVTEEQIVATVEENQIVVTVEETQTAVTVVSPQIAVTVDTEEIVVAVGDTGLGLHLIDFSNPHQVTLEQLGGTIDHTQLQNIGVNSHAAIDLHLQDLTNPHQVIAEQVDIVDAGGYFVSPDVEGALQELGASLGGGGSHWSVSGNILQPVVEGDGVLIDVPTEFREALILKTTDNDLTKKLLELRKGDNTPAFSLAADGGIDMDGAVVSNKMLLQLDGSGSITEGGITYTSGFLKLAGSGEIVYSMVRSTNSTFMSAGISGDDYRGVILSTKGVMQWGSGLVPPDTSLARIGVGTLQTQNLDLTATLDVASTTTLSGVLFVKNGATTNFQVSNSNGDVLTKGDYIISRTTQAFEANKEFISSFATGNLDLVARGDVNVYLDSNNNGSNEFNIYANNTSNLLYSFGENSALFKKDINVDTGFVYQAQGNSGVSGSFTTTDGKTVTVTSGIITSIV